MEDKRLVEKFSNKSFQELRFTKEDRMNVFERIHKTDDQRQKKSYFALSKLVPHTVSLLVVGLCMFLFIPSILQENVITNNDGTSSTGVVAQRDKDFTALFTVKDENNRIPLNLLLSYSDDKKMMKVLSIPRDTYVPILDKRNGTTMHDKLTQAYVYGSGEAENVRTTVSNLFDIPIDYYAIMDLDTFSALIDSVNGIDYDLQEDIRVRAISQVAFEFKKGMHRLNGEEVVALMMAATVGNGLDEADQLNLIDALMNKINQIPDTQLKEITSNLEGNLPIEQLIEYKTEIPTIQTVSLKDGWKDEMINGAYFITFEKDFLHSISEEITTFD